jgi:transposase
MFGWFQRARTLQAENTRLRERNRWLQERVAELEAAHTALADENRQLKERLAAARKTSRTSSKPPSSDLVKPPGQRRRKRRRHLGGQKGHAPHRRPAFTPEQISVHQPHRLARCPVDPAHRLIPVEGVYSTLQQVELVDHPFVITEHVAYRYWCEDCHQYHDAPFPEPVRQAGLFGPRLTSLVCYLKAKLHGSYSGLQAFCGEVLGLQVSRGYLAKLLQKGSRAFAEPCAALERLLPQQACLNIDETGHTEHGQRFWTWCFRAAHFVVFKIYASRGSDVLQEVLGEDFSGVLGADFWGAYRKYARQCGVLIQFCLAHLVREVKYMCEFPDPAVQRYGRGLLAGLTALFTTLHRREELAAPTFDRRLAEAQAQVWDAALAPRTHPERYGPGPVHRLIVNLVNRFERYGEGYFRFVTCPGVEPTNNSAEQAMRFVVMDRHMTQGTRSLRGRDCCARIWTVMATCALQQRSSFAWMCQAITAYLEGRQSPSLLLNSS